MILIRSWMPWMLVGSLGLCSCGTTRWSDTQRTATEQLLISDAIDRAVSELDFGDVAEKTVYLDATAVRQNVDSAYLVSTLRQHLLAGGCVIEERLEDADYVVELRAGAVGTDRRDLLFGVPAAKLPMPVPGAPAAIPEIPLITKTEQRAVAKIAAFAYNRHTGRPVWQSGVIPVESKVRDLWVLGAGPFQRGTIYKGTRFAGQRVRLPLPGPGKRPEENVSLPSVAKETHYLDSDEQLAGGKAPPKDKADAPSDVQPAGHRSPKGELPPAPPIPPGPSGTSTHRGLGKSLDLSGFERIMPRREHASAPKPITAESTNPATPPAANDAKPGG